MAGLAIGDALGAPLECLPPKKKAVMDMISGGVHCMDSGSITDDTLQALAIMDSLIQNNGFYIDDVAVRLLESYLDNRHFFGPTSSKVFDDMLKGRHYLSSSKEIYESGGGRSNGSVMRGAPIGIFFSPEKVRYYSILCSQITHYNPVACECSAFFNGMISRLCRGKERSEAYFESLNECRNSEVIKRLSCPKKYDLVPSIDALDATHCAASVFIKSSSFESALISGINLGGDADTVGALCGALAGAYWGFDAIPKKWIVGLKDIEKIEYFFSGLYELSDDLSG
ncbi:ADP-ribosylglycohydrolase family protein [Methanochimaera problematica]|uniref:ADP-ribosylglycohydrolase family protein n=1 Tax=Methanochimaera problematica TaxID=2609417 RepID=UPI002938D209|nr:ADP-ribosylglycohydrolase family protein [Methanoplanus sp. FWC-SCC4]